jgi:hypothetical protein
MCIFSIENIVKRGIFAGILRVAVLAGEACALEISQTAAFYGDSVNSLQDRT